MAKGARVVTNPRFGKRLRWKRKSINIVVRRRGGRALTAGQSNRRNILTPQMSAFPRGMRALLKYAQNDSMTTVAVTGLPGYVRYRLNSVFAPRQTGGGHQPHFYDQLATIYNGYRVDKCYYKITFSEPSQAMRVAVLAAPNTTYAPAAVAIDQAMEQRGSQWKQLCTGTGPQVIEGSVPIHKLLGVSKNGYLADDTYRAQIGGNPTQDAILTVICQTSDATASITQYFTIELWYDVLFMLPAAVGQS